MEVMASFERGVRRGHGFLERLAEKSDLGLYRVDAVGGDLPTGMCQCPLVVGPGVFHGREGFVKLLRKWGKVLFKVSNHLKSFGIRHCTFRVSFRPRGGGTLREPRWRQTEKQRKS